MNNKQIMDVVTKAWIMAEDYQDGRIVIQLKPSNRSFLISHQLGNSWESMGLNANESENRIVKVLDCRDFEPQYWEDEPETEKNRLSPGDYENVYYDIVDEIEEIISKQFDIVVKP